jgi:hypothetical protein
MDHWEFVAERKIREAFAAGQFDNLPNHGKPISLDRDPYEDPSLWMAHHLLRVNGFAPPWIEEANDIDQEIARLRLGLAKARSRYAADHASWLRDLADLRERVVELNRRILNYNLKSPSTHFHKSLLDIDAEIQAVKNAPASPP